MNTKHLIKPELLIGLDRLIEYPTFSDETIQECRRLSRETYELPVEEYARPDVDIEHVVVPHAFEGPDVSVTLYRPKNIDRPMPAYLAIHGGGFVIGSVGQGGPAYVRTAAEAGCLVVAVGYRLAPEVPAPGAVEDCYSALKWIHENAEELGVNRERVAIGGESAGGGHAAALALFARDKGDFDICYQLLIYPMLDDRTVTGRYANTNAGEFVWTKERNHYGWRSLIGDEPGGDNVSPYAAAARATDLSNLPPAYISVGTMDLFIGEDMEYATRLMNAGVDVELHVFPGAYHGYEMAYESDLAMRSEKDRRDALRRALHP